MTAFLAWSVSAVWSVPPSFDAGEPVPGQGLRQLRVPSKKLGNGVAVVGEGSVIPWHVSRADGWSLTASGPPREGDEEMPGWLVDSIGASWRAVR